MKLFSVYFLTLVVIVVACVLRWLLDPLLGDHIPFATFFIAVAFVAWLGGLRPALLATGLGLVLAWYFFVPTRFSFELKETEHTVALAMYLTVGFALAGFGEAMRIAQARLADQKEQLRTTFASIGDGVISTDADGVIQSWNSAAERLFGHSAEEAIGRHISLVIPEDRSGDEELIMARIRAGNSVENMETMRMRSDGQSIHVALTISPIRDQAGNIIGASKIVRDNTAHKQAEQALRESEEFNRSLMDGSVDCVKVLDLDGKLQSINAPGLCLMEIDDFGPLCGKEWTALWPEEAKQSIERSLESARSGVAYSFQAFCPTAKGRPCWWDVMVSPVRNAPDGPVVRLLSVSRDITERKRVEEQILYSEQLHRIAFDQAPTGMVFVGPNEQFIKVNSVMSEITGYSSDELLQMKVSELTHPDDLAADNELLHVFLCGGRRTTKMKNAICGKTATFAGSP